ncbi:AI-2E family transporter [Lentisphaerota bacterium WC36G]|nr:AI-2E family transporter [Lentisphaerae bacterium WC36]
MKIKLPQKRRLYRKFFNNLVDNGLQDSKFVEAIIVLNIAVAQRDGFMDIHEVNELKSIFQELCPNIDSGQIINNAPKITAKEIRDACKLLNASADDHQKIEIIRHLYDVAVANSDCNDEESFLVKQIADNLGVSKEEVLNIQQDAEDKIAKRSKVINSATGIAVAFVVIFLFIICAMYLKPLLFGFLLAILFLPLEKKLEYALDNSTFIKWFFSTSAVLFSPFRHVSKYITEILHLRKNKRELTPEEIAEKKQQKLIAKATMTTVSLTVIFFIVFIVSFGVATYQYMDGFRTEFKKVERQVVEHHANTLIEDDRKKSENNSKDVTENAVNANNSLSVDNKNEDKAVSNSVKDSSRAFFAVISKKLEEYKEKFIKYPAIKSVIDETKIFINNPENQLQILKKILPKTKGVVNVVVMIGSNIAMWLFNILMTIFFFSLILNKLAVASNHKHISTTTYIVDSMLNSGWLPKTNSNVKASVIEIMDNIAFKLKTWVKSYCLIIFIESVLYITIFFLIGVPYAPIVGLIAGFTILLPYIGPVSSATLTLLVCLAGGSEVAGVNTLMMVLATYIVMNGVIEQLILYPTLVGNALGLTTLETIVVVLLGGYFAGLSGMIFAVPFASVLKYLIPKVYLAINNASIKHSGKTN